MFQGSQKQWQKPGSHSAVAPERFVPAHPGADNDTDSEEEEERVREEKAAGPEQPTKMVVAEVEPSGDVDTDEEMGADSKPGQEAMEEDSD